MLIIEKNMEKIFQKLNQAGITPNQLYLLWCMREGISPGNTINIHLESRGLTPDWIEDGKLSGKSLSLLIEIDENFKDVKAKNDVDLMGKDYKKQIEAYRLAFPEIKLPSGKYARDNTKNLEVNFKWFFKNHEYDWETVLKATNKYISEYAQKDYNYMRTSKYFIKKSEKDGSITSDLASYCEMIVTGEGDRDADNFHFTEKVV